MKGLRRPARRALSGTITYMKATRTEPIRLGRAAAKLAFCWSSSWAQSPPSSPSISGHCSASRSGSVSSSV